MTSRMAGRVAWIHSAPIKALAIQELQEVSLELHGVENDRRFCIVDPEGRMLNAKRVQRFVAVRPHFDDATNQLLLEMPHGAKVKGAVELGRAIMVSIYGRSVSARIVDGPWSEALSAVADSRCIWFGSTIRARASTVPTRARVRHFYRKRPFAL